MNKSDYIEIIKAKYSFLDDFDVEIMYNIAKEKLLRSLYPYDSTINEIPSNYQMKLLEMIMKMIQRLGIENVTSYKENGISFTFASTLAEELISDIIPYAGVFGGY